MLKKKSLIIMLSLIFVFALTITTIAASEKQAPALQEKVAEGEIEPLDERLPEEPVVVEPVHEIGEYGGILNMNADSASMWSPAGQATVTYAVERENGEIIPNLIKDWEFNEEGTVFTVHLREGLRFSDGVKFTADDVMFWYEDVIQNEELTPVIPEWLMVEGELIEIEKIDDYTLQYTSPRPYWSIIDYFGSAFSGHINTVGFLPSHFLEQFHIDHNPEADELAEEEGYDNWYQLFDTKQSLGVGHWSVPEDLPNFNPWILKETEATGFIMERNPYYHKVDSEGNQLPYIDELRGLYYGADEEVKVMQILDRDVDFEAWGTQIGNYPLYVDELGEDWTWLTSQVWTGAPVVYLNPSYMEDEVLGEILREKKFRQALSLAVDREEVNEVVFFGQAEPGQVTFHPTVPGYQEEWAEAYAEYDPDRAREKLAEIGLDEKGPDGWRLRPDGEPLSLRVTCEPANPMVPDGVEIVLEHWRDIGIEAEIDIVSRDLLYERAGANTVQGLGWIMDGVLEGPLTIYEGMRFGSHTEVASGWNTWLATDGDSGVEPPEHYKENYERLQELRYADEDRKKEIFQESGDYWAEKTYGVGVVRFPVVPIIANPDLGNVDEEAAPESLDIGGYDHEIDTFYWKTEEKREETY